jgi:hypothetical protein
MANCGIKKYDKLPARVSWYDVDYLRYKLFISRKFNIGNRKEILQTLEKAFLKNKQNKKSKYNLQISKLTQIVRTDDYKNKLHHCRFFKYCNENGYSINCKLKSTDSCKQYNIFSEEMKRKIIR